VGKIVVVRSRVKIRPYGMRWKRKIVGFNMKFVPHWITIAALSIVSTTAHAQIDSNAIVTFYCSPQSGGCEFQFSGGVEHGCDGSGSASLSVSFDSSFRFCDRGKGGRYQGYGNPQFEIDSLNGMIVNLSFGKFKDIFYAGGPLATGYCSIKLSFSSLPYTKRGNNIIVALDLYPCAMRFGTYQTYGTHCSGGCSDSAFMMDSLYLVIRPEVLSIPAQDVPSTHLAIHSNATNPIIIFEQDCVPRVLEVYDLRGLSVKNFQVPPKDYSFVTHFSPGCYFARLGNEVAKFVVTE
jgi:hypothetical protein